MKRRFGLPRTRYFGRAKVHAQMVMAAIVQNLLKAANKIKLSHQAPAIASPKPPKPVCPFKRQRVRKDGKSQNWPPS